MKTAAAAAAIQEQTSRQGSNWRRELGPSLNLRFMSWEESQQTLYITLN
jgi:hypothetical protein